MTAWDLLIGGYTRDESDIAEPVGNVPEAARTAVLDDGGRLTDTGRLLSGVNPSWIAWHPGGTVAYACDEDFTAGATGSVAAWELGATEPVRVVSSGGHAPCHVAVVPDGDGLALVLSHYVGGQVSVVPLDAAGRPDEAPSDVVVHSGAAFVHPEQEAPHPHQAMFDPASGLVWVSDLGQDRLVGYRLRGGVLTEVAELVTPPGFGPRHAALHPGGNHLALVGELANEVLLCRRGQQGGWQEVSRRSTLPLGWSGRSDAAALVWSPDGAHLYASNRGHDSVAVWAFDEGALALVGHSPAGAAPRDFCLAPDGRWALSAAQGEHRVIAFPVRGDGLLGAEVGSIACRYPSRVAVRGR